MRQSPECHLCAIVHRAEDERCKKVRVQKSDNIYNSTHPNSTQIKKKEEDVATAMVVPVNEGSGLTLAH